MILVKVSVGWAPLMIRPRIFPSGEEGAMTKPGVPLMPALRAMFRSSLTLSLYLSPSRHSLNFSVSRPRSPAKVFNEAMGRFLAATYGGEYEAKLIAEFEAILPDTPPWRR